MKVYRSEHSLVIEITRKHQSSDDKPIILSELLCDGGVSEYHDDITIMINDQTHALIIDDMPRTEHTTLHIQLKPNTHLRYVLLQRDELVVDSMANARITCAVDQNATFEGAVLYAGSQASQVSVVMKLQGMHAQAHLHAAYICSGIMTTVLKTEQLHKAPHTESSVTMRVLVDDHAQSTYQGMITIEKQAPEANAQQEHKALLLSPYAQAKALPQLEVLTHEVRCGHGSAIGMIDQEQVWYLQSRGIAAFRAQQMLRQNFIMQAIPSWIPREWYQKIILE
ncbi:SufD family Fe-S cluster assembly protein [Candidatus Dependentiae bacterium]|nr:SufD family Fe-S cluster assembly protein [Candidatus Dependentiae bacterium]